MYKKVWNPAKDSRIIFFNFKYRRIMGRAFGNLQEMIKIKTRGRYKTAPVGSDFRPFFPVEPTFSN